MDGVIRTIDFQKAMKRKSRRHMTIHLCGVLLVIGLVLSGWVFDLDRRIILASFERVKGERDAIILKQELLQVLRKRPLTISNALDILEAVSNQGTIPIPIILGILEQESQFDPKAVSSKGAKGVGQLMPLVWKHYGNGTNVHDSLSNITASIAYLTDLYKQFGSWEKTLRSYAAGPDHAADKRIDWYSRSVMAKAKVYQAKIEQ